MDHTRRSLRYVPAESLDQKGRDLANMPVMGSDGEKLGSVEGFIIDTAAARPRHVVVEAGWFLHKHFLIPVGHAALGPDGTFVADITKDRVRNVPGFDQDEFQKLSPDEFEPMETDVAAFFDGDAVGGADVDAHFKTPVWWDPTYYVPPQRELRR